MSAWLWVGVAAAAWCVVAACAVVVYVVGRQSLERRGAAVFDTPEGRSALRRCNPARDVHYFGGQARCECGEVTYGTRTDSIFEDRR